ncbi:MAG: methyltransferase domain-containing protein [Candidatus Hydrogenedentes bacterium]|nr:methyltransferase domain-containing protein [Candidatus Hydrogenedentota bacterium]
MTQKAGTEPILPESAADDAAGYKSFHAPRYAFVLGLLRELGAGRDSSILDIGPSHLTELLRNEIDARVDTLGFGEDSRGERGNHYAFNLNDAQHPIEWRANLPRYSFVIMAEVLEHLYVAPQLVLGFVKTLLTADGRLIVQTPNAASLTKRVKLLLGRNPYEMIRTDPMNPGHYREYTAAELHVIARELGFVVERCETGFYFDARHVHDSRGRLVRHSALGGLKNIVYRNLPAGLREGITMVLRAG